MIFWTNLKGRLAGTTLYLMKWELSNMIEWKECVHEVEKVEVMHDLGTIAMLGGCVLLKFFGTLCM